MLKTLTSAELEIDWTLNVRVELDEERVVAYMESYDHLPPVEVYRLPPGRLVLVDGFHRNAARERLGLTTFVARVVAGTWAQAQERAARANVEHGKSLRPVERRRAVAVLLRLHPDWADNRIACALSGAVSAPTVGAVRQELEAGGELPYQEKLLGLDGRWRGRRDTEVAPEVALEPAVQTGQMGRSAERAGCGNGDGRTVSEEQETGQGDSPRAAEVVPLLALDATSVQAGSSTVYCGDVLDYYSSCAAQTPPTAIISDGAYGVGGFPGDPARPEDLPEWYAPHLEWWTRLATPATTLWFWNTEAGWAQVHPLLLAAGWQYVTLHVWDKGITHAAGNYNSLTARSLPVVTEVCVQYVREPLVVWGERAMRVQDYLRGEWRRAGLTLAQANEACGVAAAAGRKYLGRDDQWYCPPPAMWERLADYANEHGTPPGRPYFAWAEGNDGGERSIPATASTRPVLVRAKFHPEHGLTNVWAEPPVRGAERRKDAQGRALHPNQKPLLFMERLIRLATDPGDLVLDPFGGVFTAVVAALRLRRRALSVEINPLYYHTGQAWVREQAAQLQNLEVALS